MRRSRVRWAVAMLGSLALSACSREQPAAPGLHSIVGHVRLTGYLVDAGGRFAGTRVVGDADGVRVELAYGDRVVARTSTVDGTYRFSGLGPGAYVARTHLIGAVADTTDVLTISESDVFAADTLRLAARGDLYPVPNPFAQATEVYFEIPDTEQVAVEILDVAGNSVRSLLDTVLAPGLHGVIWDGLDRDGHPATAALYWVTLVAGDDIRAQLLFR